MAWNWKKQASAAYGFSLTRLALNALMYAEEREEVFKNREEKQNRFDEAWNQALAGFLEGRDILLQVQDIRKQIEQEMETVVAFTDGFQIYEYAFNRVERRFGEGGPVPDCSDEEFAEQLMNFITSERAAEVINRRIQDVMGQLPVRLTRQKYYSMVKEALGAYTGSEKRALDNALYLLKCASMAGIQGEPEASRKDLAEFLQVLQQISFKDMTAETYQKGKDTLRLASERLLGESEFYTLLQDMVNDLYVLCLTKEDAVRDAKEEASGLRLLQKISQMGQAGEPVDFQVFEEELQDLEGVQERCYERFLRMEPAPERQAGEQPQAFLGRQVELLLSTSPFVSLAEETDSGQSREVTLQDVEKAMEEYIACADPVLKSVPKPVARAIMAGALELLPVVFPSLEELEAYVKNSLSSCTDMAEKNACMELLEHLMESEDYAF